MTVELVRRIIADPHQFARSESEGDGVVTTFQLEYAPIFTGSLKVYVDGVLQVLTTDYTINLETAILDFVAAPGADIPIVATYEHSLLSDDDIQAFLDLNADNIRRAAADALDTIATSETLIQKRITLLDLKTEGEAVAKSLREHAKRLRDLDDDEADEADGLFDYAEMALSPFGSFNHWLNEHRRGNF